MSWLDESALIGNRAFAAHTGMMTFARGVRWQASDAEEGVLIREDGSLQTVMPGCDIRLDKAGRADLTVFNRSGRISGLVGCGGIVTPFGEAWSGNGEYVCSVLQPRRLAPEIAAVLHDEQAVKRIISALLRPCFRSCCEKALAEHENDHSRLRTTASAYSAEQMRDLLIPHGLLLEEFELNILKPEEDTHVLA